MIRMVPEVLEEDFDKEDDIVTQPSKKHKDVFMRVYNLNDEMREKIYTDQTCCFPTRSSHGNQYIMVMCEMDSDAILFEVMKNWVVGKMICAHQALFDKLASSEIHPNSSWQ